VIVLDTHAWIWWTSDAKKLGRSARYRLRKADRVGIPAISCWEFSMLVAHDRIRIDRGAIEWLEQALAQPRVVLLPLTPSVAVTATQLGNFQGDPADRLIVATAIIHSSKLVSRDERISECPLVEAVW
jgi:PIN domain nuclease of toxin-antitoxin system